MWPGGTAGGRDWGGGEGGVLDLSTSTSNSPAEEQLHYQLLMVNWEVSNSEVLGMQWWRIRQR